jgi:hypothetical protein
MVDENEMSAIQLDKIRNHPVTMPMFWIGVIFLAGWLGRPAAVDYMTADFFTQVQAAEHTQNVTKQLDSLEKRQVAGMGALDDHIEEYRAASAYQLERSLAADLRRHQENPNRGTAWAEQERKLLAKVQLAKQYRNCLMNENPNCHLIQKQIFQ